MLYYLIIGLQVYCAYHAYTTRNQAYWYLIILLAPGLGSLVYLFTQVFSKKDVSKVHEEITQVINPTKRITDLEKKVNFSDTFQNRVNLADAYLEIGDFQKSIDNFEKALNGHHSNDYYANSQLLKAYYAINDYTQVIEVSSILKSKPEFEKSKEQFLRGLSLIKLGDLEEAEIILKKIDQRYSNYEERYQLAEFYIDNQRNNEAIILLEEMLNEGNHMTKLNEKKYRKVFNQIRKLYESVSD